MATFGDFFNRLRRRAESTGRTDPQCRDMDRFKRAREIRGYVDLEDKDPGWLALADQELSHTNVLEFVDEMTRAALARLTAEHGETFDPERYGWALDSVHEFHHWMLEEARGLGLNVESFEGWRDAREVRKRAAHAPA